MSCNLRVPSPDERPRPSASPGAPQRAHRGAVDPDAGRAARADLHAVARGDRALLRARAPRPGHRALGRAPRRHAARDPRARQRLRSVRGGRHPAGRSARQAGRRAGAAPDLHRRVRLRASRRVVGRRIPSDRGFAGRVYSTGRPAQTDHLEPDDPLLGLAPDTGPVRSLVGVPIVVGESICGVLQLANRRSGGSYTPRDKELLRIFAAYMSSSIQNALDAIRARAQARIDDLTGLANSRYFHTRLEEEIARADREGTNLSMLFIDLDRFKEVNDRFGHLTGSWTLQKVGKLLGDNAPAGGAGRALRRRRVRRHPARRRLAIAPRRPPSRCGWRSPTRSLSSRRPTHAAHRRRCCASRRRWASRRTATTWRRAARSAAARARCCAWPTRRCTAPRRAGETASRSPSPKSRIGA